MDNTEITARNILVATGFNMYRKESKLLPNHIFDEINNHLLTEFGIELDTKLVEEDK